MAHLARDPLNNLQPNVLASSAQTVPRLSCKCVSYPLPPSGVSVSDPGRTRGGFAGISSKTPATSTCDARLPLYCPGVTSQRRAMRWAELALVANCTEGDSFCQVTSAGGNTFSTCQKLNLSPLWRQTVASKMRQRFGWREGRFVIQWAAKKARILKQSKGKGRYLNYLNQKFTQELLLEFFIFLEICAEEAEKAVNQIQHHITYFYNWMPWPPAMILKHYLSTLTNLLVSWALMIEWPTMSPKAVCPDACARDVCL